MWFHSEILFLVEKTLIKKYKATFYLKFPELSFIIYHSS